MSAREHPEVGQAGGEAHLTAWDADLEQGPPGSPLTIESDAGSAVALAWSACRESSRSYLESASAHPSGRVDNPLGADKMPPRPGQPNQSVTAA